MKKLLPLAGLCLLAFMSTSEAGIRLQHYVPELKGMAKPVADPNEQLEAFIFTPNGLTCNLPSKDGYCRIPMTWMTTKDQQVSLWRQDGSQDIRVAYAYDGQNDAYLTFGKTLTYRLHDGPASSQRLLDSVKLTAIWDDAWATNPPPSSEDGDEGWEDSPLPNGKLNAANGGTCDLYSGETSCEVLLSWSSRNVTSASVWQRTNTGLTPLIRNVKSGSVIGYGYDYPAIFELREGSESTGALLSSTLTRGKRSVSAGSLTLPDGDTCLATGTNSSCQVRVKWSSNDISRLWIRDKSHSSARLSGQSLVSIPVGDSIVDLRASSKGAGKILDRKTLKAKKSEFSGSFNLVGSAACTILYAKDNCSQDIYFKTDAPSSTVWDEDGNAISAAQEGTFTSSATEYGVAYTLREGNDFKNPPLASFISQGIKQTYTGSLATNGATQCTFNYQRGTCALKLDYTATDGASIWNAQTSSLQGGGETGGTVKAIVSNYDGAGQTLNTFDLRFHGAQTPQLSNPWLDSKELTGVRPAHTGSLKASASSCNMIYSRNDCGLSVTPASTSPLVTLWRDENGQKIWSGAPGSLVNLTIPSGTWSYTLREGDDVRNDALAAVTLTANRPTYYQRLSAPASECTASIYNGTCSLTVNSAGNTAARIWYKSSSSSALIASSTGTSALTASLPISANKRQDQTWDVQVRQGTASSGELLDEMQLVAHPNAPHSFKLVQSIAGSPDDGFCQSYESSDSCVGAWTPKWESSAVTITACLYDKATGALKASKTTTDKTFGTSLTHPKSAHFEQRFYEGNTACGTDDALLSTVELPGVKVIDADKYPFRFENKTYTCEMYYTGIGTCSGILKVVATSTLSSQSSYPIGYLKYVGVAGTPGVFDLSLASRNVDYKAQEGVIDQVVELRIRRGSSPSDDDPVLDRMVLNYTRTEVNGSAFPAKTMPTSSTLFNTSYVDGSTANSVYFKRQGSGYNWSNPEPCLLNAESSTCAVYFWLRTLPANSRSAASLFIDGVYKTASYNNSTFGAFALAEGEHEVKFYEGSGASSKDNKLLDAFVFIVKRPDASYVGQLTLASPLPTPTFYNNSTSLTYSYTTNTSGYVYNRNGQGLICSSAATVTASETATNSNACSISLKEGTYTFDLYAERTPTSTPSKLLDSKTFTIERRENGATVTAAAGYADSFDTCKLPFNQNYDSCRLWFSYLLKSGDSGAVSAMACSYDSQGALNASTGLRYYTTQTSNNILAKRGTTTVRIVDGASCPATIESSSPLILTSWAVALNETNPVGTIGITGSKVSSAGGEGYTCTRQYFNDTCSFSVNYETSPKADPGYVYLPTNSVLYRDGVIVQATTLATESYSYADSIAQGVIKRTYQNVVCKNSNSKTAANCPINDTTLMGTTGISEVVPEYTGEIGLPSGDFCEAQYNVATCPLPIKATSTSGYVTLYRDGVLVASGSTGSITSTLALPVKANGLKTKLSLYDGTNSTNGRLLDEVEVWSKQQDPNEFRFGAISGEAYSASTNSICYVSSLIASEASRNCEFKMAYSGDASSKTITANTPSQDSLNQTVVSGSGTITGSHLSSRQVTSSTQVHQSGLGSSTLRADREGQNFYLHVSDPIRYGQTAFGGQYATTPIGQGFTPSFSRGSYNRYYQCQGQAGYGQTCWYSDNGSNYANAFSTNLVADNLTLRAPTSCYSDSNNSLGCGRIPFNTLTSPLPQNEARVFGFKTSAEAVTRKVFYRAAGISEAQKAQLIDPSISAKGISRTLNLDGAWHVLDMSNNKIAGGSDVLFTFYNQGVAASVVVYFFTETEPTP